MISSAFSFYPYHAIALTLFEIFRKFMIRSGRTLVGYLSTMFENQDKGKVSNVYIGLSSHSCIRLIHKCINLLPEELVGFHLSAFAARTADDAVLRFHCVVAPYVANLPEAEHLASVLIENQSRRICRKGIAKT